MKRFVLFFCCLLWSLIFCGCTTVTAAFEGLEPADHNKIPRYKIPVKFHLQRVYFADYLKKDFIHAVQEFDSTGKKSAMKKEYELQHKMMNSPKNSKNIAGIENFLTSYGSVFKASERGKLQTDIVRYFPGIFTENPREGLACSIFIYNSGKPEERNYGVNHGLYGTLSFLSLVFLPWKQEKVQKLVLRFQVEDLSAATELPLFMKYRNSAGIFGFLGLRYLLSPAENAWFYGDAAREFNVLSIQDLHRKDFARLIVAELCKIPAEEIEKLYLARKTRGIQLME